MSGATGPLSDAERVDARRFMGYEVYGSGNTGAGFQSYRFFAWYGEMEFRLTNIGPSELVVLRAKLAELATLDAAIATAGNTMGTAQAAVWTRNKTEARDRKALFDGPPARAVRLLGRAARPGAVQRRDAAGGMTTQAVIQAQIWQGFAILAGQIGAPCAWFRPGPADYAAGEALGTVQAYVDTLPDFGSTVPRKRKQPELFAALDASLVLLGDYLTDARWGTTFVATLDPFRAATLIECNAVVTLNRPSEATPSAGYYGGDGTPRGAGGRLAVRDPARRPRHRATPARCRRATATTG